MDELVQFLRACLDEDERIARAASPGPWEQSGIGEYGWGVSFSVPGAGVEAEDSDQGRADAAHIAGHDPVRVLREIDAKRALMKVIFRYEAKIDGEWGCCHDAEEIEAGECEETPPNEIEALRVLAALYADRPGFREEWRP